MLGVQLPPGPLNDALADQPGVVATPSPWRAWVQIPSRVLTRRVGRAPASPSGCNPPASAVQVQLLPDTLTGLVAQPAEQDSLKVEVQGSTPCGATVHEWPGGGTGRHAVLRRPCPPGVRVQVPPWSLVRVALVVKGTSWLPPKEQVQVRLLAGVLSANVLGVCRWHATVRRSRVRFDSSRGCCGRTQADRGPGCEPGGCGFDSHRPP